MPKSEMPARKRAKLAEKVRGMKAWPRLTFPFVASKIRRDAVQAVERMNSRRIIKQKPPSKKLVVQLLDSENKDERKMGKELMEYTPLTEKEVANTLTYKKEKEHSSGASILYMPLKYSEANAAIKRRLKRNKGKELEVLKKERLNREEWVRQKVAIRLTAEHILGMDEKEFMSHAEEFSQHREHLIRQAAAAKFLEVGEGGLPYLEKRLNDSYSTVTMEATHSFMKILKKMPKRKRAKKLKELIKSDSPTVRKSLAAGLPYLGAEALPYLEELAEKGEGYEGSQAAKTAKAAMYFVKEDLPPDEWELMRYPHNFLGENPRGVDFKELLTNQKALFATPHTEAIIKRLNDIHKITKKMKREFGNKFLGVTLVGSTEKGYMHPSSDLDFIVLAQNKKVFKRFTELAKDLKLCKHIDDYVNPRHKKGANWLFYGIFFGNHKRLRELQKKAAEMLTNKEWEELQEHIRFHQTQSDKKTRRFDDSVLDHHTREATALLQVPPSRKETLKILRKRTKPRKA